MPRLTGKRTRVFQQTGTASPVKVSHTISSFDMSISWNMEDITNVESDDVLRDQTLADCSLSVEGFPYTDAPIEAFQQATGPKLVTVVFDRKAYLLPIIRESTDYSHGQDGTLTLSAAWQGSGGNVVRSWKALWQDAWPTPASGTYLFTVRAADLPTGFVFNKANTWISTGTYTVANSSGDLLVRVAESSNPDTTIPLIIALRP